MFYNILMTLLLAMTPVIELRGAIPAGVLSGLPIRLALIVSIIGNLLPIPFILYFLRAIFDYIKENNHWLHDFVILLEKKAEKKKRAIHRYEWWGLVLIVAVPLPGTGAWTGALVAAMLDMRIKKAFPAIAIGVVIAGLLVAYLTYGARAIF